MSTRVGSLADPIVLFLIILSLRGEGGAGLGVQVGGRGGGTTRWGRSAGDRVLK